MRFGIRGAIAVVVLVLFVYELAELGLKVGFHQSNVHTVGGHAMATPPVHSAGACAHEASWDVQFDGRRGLWLGVLQDHAGEATVQVSVRDGCGGSAYVQTRSRVQVRCFGLYGYSQCDALLDEEAGKLVSQGAVEASQRLLEAS